MSFIPSDFRRWFCLLLLTMVMFFSSSLPAFALVAEINNYVKQYQFGVDYSNSMDHVNLSYETSSGNGVPKSCGTLATDATKMQCGVGVVGGSSNGWGVFLQKAFKKKGFYYWDFDLSFGARYLNGELPAKERSLSGLPLKTVSFSLGALVAKPYIQFGITPERWPDILISMGPALQFAAGTMAINGKTENVAFGTSSVTGPMSLIRGFLAVELVLRRFGEGAFSLMLSHDVTGHGRGTKIYPKDVDGMSNFRGVFNRNVGGMAFGFGLKLVTPWP